MYDRIVNHTLYPEAGFLSHSPEKFQDFKENGGFYAGRVLLTTTGRDVVQLDPRIDEYTQQFMQEQGLAQGVHIAHRFVRDNNHLLATKPEYADLEYSFYQFGQRIHEARPDSRRLKATDAAGDKNKFVPWANKLGPEVNVPWFQIFETGNNGSNNHKMKDLKEFPFPLYLKAAVSSQGKTIIRVENPAEYEAAVPLMGDRYQAQQAIDKQADVSVQYNSTNERVYRLAITDQEMDKDGQSHIGNKYPSDFDPTSVTDPVAEALRDEGLRGMFGLDAVIDQDGKAWLLECNPRHTAATYPVLYADRLGVDEWRAVYVTTSFDHISKVKFGEELFEHNKEVGYVVMNAARMACHGKVELLLIGDQDAQLEMITKAARTFKSPSGQPQLADM